MYDKDKYDELARNLLAEMVELYGDEPFEERLSDESVIMEAEFLIT